MSYMWKNPCKYAKVETKSHKYIPGVYKIFLVSQNQNPTWPDFFQNKEKEKHFI